MGSAFLMEGDRRLADRQLGFACEIEMNGEVRLTGGVGVAAQRGEEAEDVGGAAGAAEPILPVVRAAAGEGVFVEEVGTVQGDAAEEAVVERAFQHVAVLAVACELQHAVGEEDQADGGAGFAVGGIVGQIVIFAEPLPAAFGADPTGQIHAALGDAIPQAVADRPQFRILRFRGEVGGGAVEVDRAHGVADRVGLLAQRRVGLEVLQVGVEPGKARAAASSSK